MTDATDSGEGSLGSDAARLLERGEARAYARLVEGATEELSQRYGLAVHHIGAVHAFVAARYADSLILNRVIGLGVDGSASGDVLDELDRLYLAYGVSAYAVEAGPHAAAGDLAAQLRARRFVPFKKTGMLYRRAEMVAKWPSELDVRRAGAEHAADFANLCCGIFGFGEPFPDLLRETFESPDWQHWMAFDADKPVAAAITHFEGDAAWIGWVCTLQSHRGRGAQAALATVQLRDASARGVRWVTLEAATGRNGPSQSFRNYVRLGWIPAYDRIVYLRHLRRAPNEGER